MNGKRAKKLRRLALKLAGPSKLYEKDLTGNIVDKTPGLKPRKTGETFTVRTIRWLGQRRALKILKRDHKNQRGNHEATDHRSASDKEAPEK